MESLLTDNQHETKFVVKVNGKVRTTPLASRSLAESAIQNLPLEEQAVAKIVPITEDGQEILLG